MSYFMKDENLDYFHPMFVGMQTSIIDTDLSLCHIGTIESRSPRPFLFELKISDALLLLTVLILYLPRCIILPTFAALQFLAIPLVDWIIYVSIAFLANVIILN